MDVDVFRKVEELFERALEIEPDGRIAFVEGTASAEPEVRDRVKRLLRHADRENGTADNESSWPGGDLGRAGASTTGIEQPGATIGRYKIRQLIGEGGFGLVYMAEQETPIRRKVAIKVIKLGMDTKQVIARFEAERQALAIMEHPNIARVLDAGATDTGRPYFAMELVRGSPITEYCDDHNLSTAERLELFVPVCQAVQHAHQKGIIHRDIKPSNVIVTLHDGEATPKVIDFGIAKAVNQPLTEKTLFTHHHQFIGTPEYMSPEQVGMSGLDIDTRSDVYSLGVLLYELLTGATPVDRQKLRSSVYAEMQRMIREDEAPKPSTRLSSAAARPDDENLTIEAIARRRNTDPSALRTLLRGDLDWIVMKALEKSRARRYETAAALSHDIGRHLRCEPVSASPPSAAYVVRKFTMRHRAAVAASMIMVVALVAGGLVAGVGFVKARFEAGRAQRAHTEAVEQRDVAEAVTQFLADMLTAVDPREQGKDVTVREVLDEASARIGTDFEDQPVIEARLRVAMGTTYRSLGDYEAAEPHLREALAINERELGETHPRTLESMDALAELCWNRGRVEDAARLFGRALDIRRRVLDPADPLLLGSMNNLGVMYRNMGRYEETEALYRESYRVRLEVLGPEHPDTLTSMNNLALLYKRQGKFADAEPLYVAALERRRKVLGHDHPDVFSSMNNLAALHAMQGRYDAAEAMYEEALEGRTRVLGEQHPQTIRILNNLADLYQTQDRHEDAAPLLRRALVARREQLGDRHPATLNTMNNMAVLYRSLGLFDEAEAMHRETYDGRRETLGPEHPRTLLSLGNLANLARVRGRLDEAERLNDEALEARARTLGPDHPDTLISQQLVGLLLIERERYDEAATILTEVARKQQEALGGDHMTVAETLAALGRSLLASGRRDGAIEAMRDAHRIMTGSLGADASKTLEIAALLEEARTGAAGDG